VRVQLSATHTICSVSAAEFRADLDRLLQLAGSVASAEARLESFAADMAALRKWERLELSEGMLRAVSGGVTGALTAARNEDNRSDFHGLDKAQEIQGALVLYDFVIAHERLDEPA
jgi:hypothetical protein